MRVRDRVQALTVRVALVLLAILGVGCGEDLSLGGPRERARIGLCSQGAELELVDDMEDRSPAIHKTSGRAGSWFEFNNDTGVQEPDLETFDFFPMAELQPPRESSSYGAWTRGNGFRDWGAGIGFEFASQDAYDASNYAGFAFWARRGSGASETLRADVTDRNTTPLGLVCDPLACEPGGMCDPAARACYDNFGVNLELTEDWQFFSYHWEELTQAGWSGNDYQAITTSSVYGMRFQSEPEIGFEFWIDDVALLCP
jgi:hypothetical protein